MTAWGAKAPAALSAARPVLSATDMGGTTGVFGKTGWFPAYALRKGLAGPAGDVTGQGVSACSSHHARRLNTSTLALQPILADSALDPGVSEGERLRSRPLVRGGEAGRLRTATQRVSETMSSSSVPRRSRL